MKKVLSLSLILILALSCFVACGGSNAPAELTPETLVGNWSTTMVVGESSLEVIVEFTADGKYVTHVDEEAYRAFLRESYTAMGGIEDMDAAIDAAVAAREETASTEYTFDGETMTIGGVAATFEYEDGILTITQMGVDMSLAYVGE